MRKQQILSLLEGLNEGDGLEEHGVDGRMIIK
jgi:hypothetical protein